jgi:hypothetical protein
MRSTSRPAFVLLRPVTSFKKGALFIIMLFNDAVLTSEVFTFEWDENVIMSGE